MKSKMIRFALYVTALCLILSDPVWAYRGSRDPMKEPWYTPAVNYRFRKVCLGEEVPEDLNNLQKQVTWSDLAETLSKLDKNYSDANYQTDLSSGPVAWAKDLAIMDRDLGGDDEVTRLDGARALATFLKKSCAKSQAPLSSTGFSDFSDIPRVDREAVLFVKANGLMKGHADGHFGGNEPLLVCQLIQILYNGRELFSGIRLDKLFLLDPAQVDSIEIQDGTTGDVKVIRERDQVAKLVKLLNSFRFHKAEFSDRDGWTCRMKLYSSSGLEADFTLSVDSVTLNRTRYLSNDPHFSTVVK